MHLDKQLYFHKNNMKQTTKSNTTLSKQNIETGNNIGFVEIVILHREFNIIKRKILEGIHINQNLAIALINKNEVEIVGVAYADILNKLV